MEAKTWNQDGSRHDFGHPEADCLSIESYNNGAMDFGVIDGGDDGQWYTLDPIDCKVLLGILIDHLQRSNPFGRLGCILAGVQLPEGRSCPFCRENPTEES